MVHTYVYYVTAVAINPRHSEAGTAAHMYASRGFRYSSICVERERAHEGVTESELYGTFQNCTPYQSVQAYVVGVQLS